MVVAGDFKNGITFDMEGAVYQVIEFQHVKPGKGAAFVRTKLKNVISGAVVEKTFSPTDKYENAYIERKDMQYSYNDGDLYYFMDQDTFDMLPLNSAKHWQQPYSVQNREPVRCPYLLYPKQNHPIPIWT